MDGQELDVRATGVAGVIAGLGLIVEGALWSSSGWTPDTFREPANAIGFLLASGGDVRAAVFAGAVNLVFATIFLVGLTAFLRPAAPTCAAAVRYLGVVGIAAHALVPIGLWLGIPLFIELAAGDRGAAIAGWPGFAAFIAGAGGVGSLFLGSSVAVAGLAFLSARGFSSILGWMAVLGGGGSVLTVLAADTVVDGVAEAVYFPSLLLVIVFRIWAGATLWRAGSPSRSGRRVVANPGKAAG